MVHAAQSHEFFMKQALNQAQEAFEQDEVPVGAVVVYNNQIVARAHNLTETLNDPTAHAEMQAITAASNYIGGKYLSQASLYVTLEPCIMCAGALYWAQIGNIIYGASDTKRGYQVCKSEILHPKTNITKGVLTKECEEILKTFFKNKR